MGLSAMNRPEFPVLNGNENERFSSGTPCTRSVLIDICTSGKHLVLGLPQLELFLFLAMVFWTIS